MPNPRLSTPNSKQKHRFAILRLAVKGLLGGTTGANKNMMIIFDAQLKSRKLLDIICAFSATRDAV